MSRTRTRALTRGLALALAGTSAHAIAAGLLFLAWSLWSSTAALHAFWTTVAGILVWVHLAVSYWLFRSESQANLDAQSEEPVDKTQRGRKRKPGNLVLVLQHFYYRYILTIIEAGVGSALALSTIAWFRMPSSPGPGGAPMVVLAASSVAAIFGVILTVFFRRISTGQVLRLLRTGASYTLVMTGALVAISVSAGLDYLRATSPVPTGFVVLFNGILGAEILLGLITKSFRPARPGHLPRPAFQSYLLEALSDPSDFRKTVQGMLHDLLGFDVSTTALYGFVRQALLPFLAGSLLLMASMSTVVPISEGREAIVTRMGRLRKTTFGPGIHLKLPWPVERVRVFETSLLRKLHVGSHQPDTLGGEVLKEGVPILWTNSHGVRQDELLIVAAPTGLANGSDGRETRSGPSVSLAGADIRVEYVIDNILSFVGSSSNPVLLMKQTAMAEASWVLYRHEIDDLFCEARLDVSRELHERIQKRWETDGLGTKIIHVGITAVHPPLPVADAFEQTVIEHQKRETLIQAARQTAIREQIETAGSREAFAGLVALIDSAEAGSAKSMRRLETLVDNCRGAVSEMLSGAYGYRWSRENSERGKTERFEQEALLYRTAPRNYRHERYFDILERALPEKSKTLVLGDADRMMIRMGMSARSAAPFELPDDEDF